MHAEPTTGLRKLQPITKATRLIKQDRVLFDPDAVVYQVQGDHDTYRVICSPEGVWCPCPATTSLCSHVLAATMAWQSEGVRA